MNGLFTPNKGKKKGFQITLDTMEAVDRYAELTSRSRTNAGEVLLKVILGQMDEPEGHQAAIEKIMEERIEKSMEDTQASISEIMENYKREHPI